MQNIESPFYQSRESHQLDWFEIVKQFQANATASSTRIQIQDLQKFKTPDEALKMQSHILDAATVVKAGFRPFMESLDLFEPWYARIKKKAVLKTIELKDIRQFCLEIISLDQVLQETATHWGRSLRSKLFKSSEPLSAIDQIITPRGEIRSDASETLFRLFREKESLSKTVQTTMDRLVHDHQMTSFLQDKYSTTREGRWVLPIRSGMQHHLPGVIHGSSQTKQTVYMEPEALVPLNNRLRQIEVEIEDEIERLLTELSVYLATKIDDFFQAKLILEEADLIIAIAQWVIRVDAKPFQFSENEILLSELKHPLLLTTKKEVIPNNVHLKTDKSILLLSGPNAGGKTVLLKSIGISAKLSQHGIPICAAENSLLPFFDNIKIGIGDSQNVEENLSTFAAHLKILQESAKLKGFKNLILIDEICGSTDPEEGSALARSFIEEFAASKVFAVITSHLSQLKTGWKPEQPILNGSMEFDNKLGRPTYNFLPGIAGESLALMTAKRVGIDLKIIDRAASYLSPENRKRLSQLEEIDQLKSDIQGLRAQLNKEIKKATSEKDKYESLLSQLQKEKDKQVEKVVTEYRDKIDEMISHVKAEQTFKKYQGLHDIKMQLPQIVKAKVGAESNTVGSAEEFSKAYPSGTKAFIISLGQDGVIQSEPNNRGEVYVLSNSMRLSIHWTDLKPAAKPVNQNAENIRRSGNVTVSLNDSERVLDFRGKTVEDAIQDLEVELDQAVLNKEDRIKIIHGHGTEALKKGVRTYLSRSVYVKKWKAGTSDSGGDGITWVELADE
jgi:DNA mismatch repair protein MutS2